MLLITSVIAAALTIIFVKLSFAVIGLRRKNKVGLGSGGHDRFDREAKRLTGLLDSILANKEYVAGIYSADYPNVKRWFDHVASRPAVKVAISKLEALVPPTLKEL